MALSPWSHWNEACTMAVPSRRACSVRTAAQIATRGSQAQFGSAVHGMPTRQAAPQPDSRSKEGHSAPRARCSKEGASVCWTARFCRSLPFVLARSPTRHMRQGTCSRSMHWWSHFRGPCHWIHGRAVSNVVELAPDVGLSECIRELGMPTWCTCSELPHG